jgi:hypothetical protein
VALNTINLNLSLLAIGRKSDEFSILFVDLVLKIMIVTIDSGLKA